MTRMSGHLLGIWGREWGVLGSYLHAHFQPQPGPWFKQTPDASTSKLDFVSSSMVFVFVDSRPFYSWVILVAFYEGVRMTGMPNPPCLTRVLIAFDWALLPASCSSALSLLLRWPKLYVSARLIFLKHGSNYITPQLKIFHCLLILLQNLNARKDCTSSPLSAWIFCPQWLVTGHLPELLQQRGTHSFLGHLFSYGRGPFARRSFPVYRELKYLSWNLKLLTQNSDLWILKLEA